MAIDEGIGEVCHNLSKWGTLEDCEDFLRSLSKKITPEQGVEVYIYLRDHAGRHETEWRDRFVVFFPQSEALLPPIRELEYWQDELFCLIRAGDLAGVQVFLQRIGLMDITFDPKHTYTECAEMGYPDALECMPFNFYPVEGGDEEGLDAVTLAQTLGRTEIVGLLEGAIAGLHSRYMQAYEQGRLLMAQ
jgi:hypothetical protein